VTYTDAGHHRLAWLAAMMAALCHARAAEPLKLIDPQATYYSGTSEEFSRVIDGVPAGPEGWSPAPRAYEPQSLVLRCERPVEAAELDVTLFFLAARPLNSLAEFSLSYTTDAEPSLRGNWRPLEITRFTADVNTLRRTPEGSLRIDLFPNLVTGNMPDDVYRLVTRLPGGRATGFRLDAIPVQLPGTETRALSWWPPHDFTLTEFRIATHVRETTNIALHQPVTASHGLFIQREYQQQQVASSLTDGLPATFAHSDDPNLGPAFFFEIDLGRVVNLDHFNLRNRGDEAFDRMSRLRLKWFDQAPSGGASPAWEIFHRSDGSHPAPGGIDVLRGGDGKGRFRGRYLRISSESPAPNSPQIAEVEVYEKRTPVLVSAQADGKLLGPHGKLAVPPGTRRLQLKLAIPQSGMPPGNTYRWRLSGEFPDWQDASQLIIDMACPQPGEHLFEAQALHSDNEWDASVFRMPIVVRQHPWENRALQAAGFSAAILAAVFLSRRVMKRRTARLVATANARAALAEERSRIARDLHDDLGANLAEIAMISELARDSLPQEHPARKPLDKIFDRAEGNARRLGEIVWAVNPANDTLEHFTKYLCKFAQDYLSSAGVRSRFDLPKYMPPGSFSAAQRYHLLLAAKEAIHNAVRHGHPDTVSLKLAVGDGRFVVTITDNGCGCDPAAPAASPRGCGNMRLRMETIGGTFHLRSSLGQGTTVILSAPFSA
jgi:signal transduction histidine kinase